MRTITIAAQKGGAGKTTLALHLATIAQSDRPTLLIDTDPQGSLAFWYGRRQATTPLLITKGASHLPGIQKMAETEGIGWIIVDTAPHDSASMAAAIRAADLVLIPARPSALDLHAIEATLRMVKELKKPSLVVLSQCPPRRGFGDPLAVREAREVVGAMGGNVAEAFVTSRAIAAQSVVAGLSVGELEPGGQSAMEFERIWQEAKGVMRNG